MVRLSSLGPSALQKCALPILLLPVLVIMIVLVLVLVQGLVLATGFRRGGGVLTASGGLSGINVIGYIIIPGDEEGP